MIYDSIIVGAGPAGMSAGVQLSRAGLKVLLIEKNEAGGLLRNANCVENYLGFHSPCGAEMVMEFQKQLEDFSVPLVRGEVLEIQTGRTFSVRTKKKNYFARTVLLAIGTEADLLEVSGEKKLAGKKVFYELADLLKNFNKGKILVVGGGDVGFDYALNLSGRGFRSILITRGEGAALPVLKSRAGKSGIPVYENVCVKKIGLGEKGLLVDCTQRQFKVDAVLVAVGRHVQMPKIGMQKRIKGLYFAGDVKHFAIRQSQIAAGEGLMAAMQIIHQLSNANRSRNRK